MRDWRPVGWFQGGGLHDEVNGEYKENFMTNAYETGADAMLEAQRRNCIIQTYTVLPLEVSFTINEPGVVVFIPDQKPPDGCNSEES